MQNNPCALESEALSVQSTPNHVVAESPEDVWNVWPYCWAVSSYEFARSRFHSFHGMYLEWKLARHNLHAQQEFREHLWKRWPVEQTDELPDLRLV